MDKDAAWYGVRPQKLGPGHIVLGGDWDPAPPTERDTAAPNFSAHV